MERNTILRGKPGLDVTTSPALDAVAERANDSKPPPLDSSTKSRIPPRVESTAAHRLSWDDGSLLPGLEQQIDHRLRRHVMSGGVGMIRIIGDEQ